MAFSELSNPLNGKLKVLPFGAGAIGTYIGGSLALAGHQVVFVEKPAIVDELRDRSLRLDRRWIRAAKPMKPSVSRLPPF